MSKSTRLTDTQRRTVYQALHRVVGDVRARQGEFYELNICDELQEKMAEEIEAIEAIAHTFQVAEVVELFVGEADPKDATPELLAIAEAFEVRGPDSDGLVWIHMHGSNGGASAGVNVGWNDGIAAQVALRLEASRRAAIAKARGEA